MVPGGGTQKKGAFYGNDLLGTKVSTERHGCYGAGKGRWGASIFHSYIGGLRTHLCSGREGAAAGAKVLASEAGKETGAEGTACVHLRQWLSRLRKTPLESY